MSPDTSATDTYRPLYRRAAGPQLVMLFVGSSSCHWSNDPELPPLVEALKSSLATYAAEHDMAFETFGVAVDWAADAGIEHLASFGEFDEVAVGNNWMNSILLDHVWELDQPLTTPAVFVYRQELRVDADTVAGTFQRVAREDRELLLFRTGLDGIRSLAASAPERLLEQRDGMQMEAPAQGEWPDGSGETAPAVDGGFERESS